MVKELQAVVCVLVGGSYFMGVIGLIFIGWLLREQARAWQTHWITNRQTDSTNLTSDVCVCACVHVWCFFLFFVFSAESTVELEWKSGLLTLWCDREHLGVSMCEWAASTLQLLKDTKRTDGEPTKKKTGKTGTLCTHKYANVQYT